MTPGRISWNEFPHDKDGPKILSQQEPEYKEKKKLQIGFHIILKNYKYSKSLFLNILRYNHLPQKKKIKKIMFFFFF